MTTIETVLAILDVVLVFLLAAAAWTCSYYRKLAESRKEALTKLTRLYLRWVNADSLKEVEEADRDVPGDLRGLVWQATAKEYERAQRILRANDREAARAFINENLGRRNIRKSLMFGLLYQRPDV